MFETAESQQLYPLIKHWFKIFIIIMIITVISNIGISESEICLKEVKHYY